MTTYIKVMADQDLADSHPSKGFQMITLRDGDRFEFLPKPYEDLTCSLLEIVRQQFDSEFQLPREKYTVHGNVYVMNDMGKTIATFTAGGPQLKPK